MDSLAQQFFDVLAECSQIVTLGVGGLVVLLVSGLFAWYTRETRNMLAREKERQELDRILTALLDYQEAICLQKKWNTPDDKKKLHRLYPILQRASAILHRHNIKHPEFYWNRGLTEFGEWIRVMAITVSYDDRREVRSHVERYYREKYPDEWEIPITRPTKVVLALSHVAPTRLLATLPRAIPFVSQDFRIKWVLRLFRQEIEDIIDVSISEAEENDELMLRIKKLYLALERQGLRTPSPKYPRSVTDSERQRVHQDWLRSMLPLVEEIEPGGIEEYNYIVEENERGDLAASTESSEDV